MDRLLSELERASQAEPDNGEAWQRWQLNRVRSYGLGVYWDWLGDRLVWNRLSHDLQDQAMAYVASLLGAEFKHNLSREYQCAGISHRLGVFTHVKTGMEMVLVPGGTYMMGGDERDNEKPIHKETIKPLLVGRYPVTQKQWDAIGGDDNRNWNGPNLPIERVSWDDCKAWLGKASDALRLLSDSEWEYACRAGSTTEYFWGDEMDGSYCWYSGNSGFKTHDVTERANKFNAFGLVDMSGNVWEWCEDGWIDDYRHHTTTNHQPRNTSNPSYRVIRGGSWINYEANCRSALSHRNHRNAPRSARSLYLGFRVARSLPCFI